MATGVPMILAIARNLGSCGRGSVHRTKKEHRQFGNPTVSTSERSAIVGEFVDASQPRREREMKRMVSTLTRLLKKKLRGTIAG
jgi:hypothetical protein